MSKCHTFLHDISLINKKNLNSVGSIYRPQIEKNAYFMVDKSTLRDKFGI